MFYVLCFFLFLNIKIKDLYKILNQKLSWREKLELIKELAFVTKEASKLGKDFLAFYELVTSPANKILDKWFESGK